MTDTSLDDLTLMYEDDAPVLSPISQRIIAAGRQLRQRQDLCADAMRYTLTDIDTYIRGVRGALRRGRPSYTLCRDYLRRVRDFHELQERAGELELYGPLCDPQEPMPFRPQIVGVSAAERFRMEWTPIA